MACPRSHSLEAVESGLIWLQKEPLCPSIPPLFSVLKQEKVFVDSGPRDKL